MKTIRLLCLAFLAMIINSVKAADTDYTNEPISVTWSMSEGKENSEAVLSDEKTVMDYSWTIGSGLGLAANPTRDISGETVTVFYPKLDTGKTSAQSYNSIYYVEWTLTPYDALFFQPTKVTLNAYRIGTDSPVMYVYLVDGEGEVHEIGSKVAMGRRDNTHDEEVTKTFDLTGIVASQEPVTLRICVDNFPYNKTIGFANVKIEGKVNGTSHYRENYAINISANNDAYGTVSSNRTSVVEGNPVTLTATPNRGYRFIGWMDSGSTYVSTEQSYTFIPEENVNLTGVFEALTEYQVNVVSNIDGAGNINVTTFGDGKYYEGDVIEISALPNTGYAFANWSDNETAWKRNAVTLSNDINLTANFETIGEPSTYAKWSLVGNTDAETIGNVTGSFNCYNLIDTDKTFTIDDAEMRLFTATGSNVTGEVDFTLGIDCAPGQVFVARSIELDAARVGSSFGQFSINVGGYNIDSDLYPGSFIGGVDYPYQHYYYNLGSNMEFTSDVTISLTTEDVSDIEDKGIAFGNVIVQGYYKTNQVQVAVPSNGYTTYSSPYALSFSGSGLTAYTASYDGNEVTFTKVTSVPANTGLLIKGEAGAYMVNVVETANTVDDNVLVPCVEGGTIQPTGTEGQNMAFMQKTTGLGFHTFTTERTLNVNTAYMQLPSAAEINFVSAPNQSFTFDENAVAMSQASAKSATATVKRTIASGEWSTICLPFSMNATQTRSAFGNSVQLAKFVKYETNAAVTNISVIFEDVNLSSEGFAANTPYIIKTAKNISQFTVNDVDIEPDEDGTKTEYSEGSTVLGTFKGTYRAQTTVPENALFLSDNLFWYSVGLTQMKAFRAYFDFVDVLADMDNSANGITISLDGEATGIGTMQGSSIKAGKTAMYNLQGQRITKPAKGVFIMDGKKIVIE